MVKVNREAFVKALEAVQPGLAPRELLEQSTCFIFSGGQVQALNDEVVASAPLDLGDEVRGAVRAAKLLEILHKLPEEELNVGVEAGKLILLGKKRKTWIAMEADVLHPLVGTVDRPAEWKPLHRDFAEAVGVVGLSAGTDQSIFARVCVHVTPDWVEAHDGVQACRWRLPTGFSGEQRPSGAWSGSLVRQASIKHIVSLNMNEFGETKSWLHFRNADGVVLSIRRYVDEYPEDSQGEYERDDGTALVFPKGLIDAADNASVFSRDTVDGNVVKVELKAGQVRLTGEGVSGGHKETKKIAYEGEPVSFLISPDLLADIIKRHAEVKITHNRLRVVGGAYRYMVCLFSPQALKREAEAEELEEAVA